MPDQPLQPGGHQIFAQWSPVQAGLDMKSRFVADDPDMQRSILELVKAIF